MAKISYKNDRYLFQLDNVTGSIGNSVKWNYNNAEIVFTPQRLVTREARIIVEYEYTDQNYLRSLYAVNSEYKTDKYKFNINFYNEQDSKNATGQIELDSTDILILSGSDGSPGSLLRSGVRMLETNTVTENTVLYNKALNPSSGDSILVYSKEWNIRPVE